MGRQQNVKMRVQKFWVPFTKYIFFKIIKRCKRLAVND